VHCSEVRRSPYNKSTSGLPLMEKEKRKGNQKRNKEKGWTPMVREVLWDQSNA